MSDETETLPVAPSLDERVSGLERAILSLTDRALPQAEAAPVAAPEISASETESAE